MSNCLYIILDSACTYLLHLSNPMYTISKLRQTQAIKCHTMTLDYIKHFNLPTYRKQTPVYLLLEKLLPEGKFSPLSWGPAKQSTLVLQECFAEWQGHVDIHSNFISILHSCNVANNLLTDEPSWTVLLPMDNVYNFLSSHYQAGNPLTALELHPQNITGLHSKVSDICAHCTCLQTSISHTL